jgi:hypothetical protein
MNPRRSIALIAGAIALLALLACGPLGLGGVKSAASTTVAKTVETAVATVKSELSTTVAKDTATPSGEELATGEPSAEPTSESAVATPESAATTDVSGQGGVVLPDLSKSLEGVDTYSAQFQISTIDKSTPEAQPQIWKMTEVVDQPKQAQHVTMEGTGQDGKTFTMESIQIGQDSWIKMGDSWMQSKSGDSQSVSSSLSSFMTQGNSMLDGVKNPELVEKGVTVNGFKADHYKFSETDAAGLAAGARVNGETWLSQDGKYLVKLITHVEGYSMTGESSSASMDMTWELLSLNQPVDIKPPDMGATLPIMDGAIQDSNYIVSSGLASFEIKSTAADVFKWYESKLTADGWSKTSEDVASGMASYEKAGATITLIASPKEGSDGLVSVTVMQSAAAAG